MIMLKKASECYKYVHQQYVDPFKLFSNDVEKMGFFSRNGKKTKMLLHIIENDKNLWQNTGPSHVFRYMENI